MTDPETTLQAALNPNFWQDHSYGIDMVEHANFPLHEIKNTDLDYLVAVEKTNRTVLGMPLIPNFSRVARLYADPQLMTVLPTNCS